MTGRTLAILALVVGSYLAPTTASAQKIGLKQPSFDSAGVPIHYIVRGPEDAEAVVLIHGFADRMEPMWTQVIAALKGDFKVIALDCRGHGGSGKPHDPKQYGREMVEDVVRLLDHLKIDKAHIVGYSMGSNIGLGLAVHHPERVRTLTLGGYGGAEGDRKAGMLEIADSLADSLEKGQGIGPVLIFLTPIGQPKPTPEFIKQTNDAFHSINDPQALAASVRGAVSENGLLVSDEQIQDVRVPMLAMIGENDPVRPSVDQLKHLRPMTKVVVIEKTHHNTAWTRPEFISSLRQFLDENRQSPVK